MQHTRTTDYILQNDHKLKPTLLLNCFNKNVHLITFRNL